MHSCGRGDAFLITAAGGHIFHLPPGAMICQRYHILRKKNHPAAVIHRTHKKKDGSVSGTILYHGQDAFCCIVAIFASCLLPHHALYYYIMPPIPPAGIAGAGSFSGISAMAHSVVRNIPATEAAFSRATRDTLVGSMTPASYMLTNSSVLAL